MAKQKNFGKKKDSDSDDILGRKNKPKNSSSKEVDSDVAVVEYEVNNDVVVNTEVNLEVNTEVNLNTNEKEIVMKDENEMLVEGAEVELNSGADNSAPVNVETDTNMFLYSMRELKFRTQLRYDDDSGNDTRLPGVEYEEFETDKDGNTIMENGEPKQITYRQKPGLRRKKTSVQVRYPLLAYFGIATTISGDFNKTTNTYPKAEFQTLFEGIQATIDEAIDSWMNNEKTAGTPPTYDQVSWEVISSTPKSSRKAIQISREDLVAAIESYCEIMQGLGKAQKGIEMTQTLFKTRCRNIYMVDTSAVKVIRGNLGVWFDTLTEEKQGEFQDVFAFLDRQLEQALVETDITDIL